jgi:hypothetical protein
VVTTADYQPTTTTGGQLLTTAKQKQKQKQKQRSDCKRLKKCSEPNFKGRSRLFRNFERFWNP